MRGVAEARVTAERWIEEVLVDLGERAYAVVVGEDVLDDVGRRTAALGFAGRAGLVTSERVGALYAARVVASLRAAGLDPVVVTMPDGEEHKTLARLGTVQDRLLAAGLDRRSPVVALGGGVVTDLAGFAAATLLRGLPTVLVPTTLVGQVDAAIGGKTAVNHAQGKNLIGVFHQPRLVLADVGVLATLSAREFAAGLAEVVKYGAIGNAELFRGLETDLDAVLGRDPGRLAPVVAACSRQKAAVVVEDEREERGGRAVLNFGHTVGHALEAATGYRRFLHGEAVAIGMVAAARISARLGRCGAEVGDRIARLLMRAGLPTEIPGNVSREALVDAVQRDKKSRGGRIRFVCIEEIGRTGFVDLSGQEIVSGL
ncbi:MAG TPA: 3-dehydroquinate synthase [Candidatus Binatia bacterium]|nr:3-dehydroquinate synthase [Candidatus Binatia bacterium]